MSVKAIGEYTLKGKGIVWGGRDLQGDTFTPATDLGETRSFIGMPVYYDHSLGDLRRQIGVVKAWAPDDDGIDVEIELDRRDKYAKQVMQLVKRGALGLSTGALSHLVVRESGELKRWVVGEISLTPTPAEPRTTATSDVEATAKGITAAVRTYAYAYSEQPTPKGTNTMNKEEMKAAVLEILADTAGEPVAGGVVDSTRQAPATKKLTSRGFSNEQSESIVHYLKTGDEVAAKATLVEGTGANGGFLVPRDFYNQVIDKRDQSWIGAKLGIQRYTTDRQIFDIADQNAKANFAFVAESGAANFDEPTFEIGRAYARHLNDYMINGTGSSQPYGVLTRATVSETLASVSGIDQTDVHNIVYKLPAWYVDDGNATGWVMQNSTLGAIRALQGNFYSFQPTPMGSIDNLYGKPIAVTDKIAVLGTGNKSVIFGNWSYYAFVENLGLEVSRNPYVYQPNYQTAIFVTARWGGDVTQAEAFVYGVNP